MKFGLPLMKNVIMLQAKNLLVPLRLTAATSAILAAVQKSIFGSATTLIISDEKMNDIMKDSGLLIKDVKTEAKEQKEDVLTCY